MLTREWNENISELSSIKTIRMKCFEAILFCYVQKIKSRDSYKQHPETEQQKYIFGKKQKCYFPHQFYCHLIDRFFHFQPPKKLRNENENENKKEIKNSLREFLSRIVFETIISFADKNSKLRAAAKRNLFFVLVAFPAPNGFLKKEVSGVEVKEKREKEEFYCHLSEEEKEVFFFFKWLILLHWIHQNTHENINGNSSIYRN